MISIGLRIIQNDFMSKEPLTSMGPMKAKGDLSAPSIRVIGFLRVFGDLEVRESLAVMGPLKIGGNLYNQKDSISKVNGAAKIKGEVIGGEIKINGLLKARNVEVVSFRLNGSARVEQNIVATDKISFGIEYRTKVEVGGVIQAPRVEFRYHKTNEFINKVRNIFFQRSFEKGVLIEGLRIRTKILHLYKVEVAGDIQAEELKRLEYINE